MRAEYDIIAEVRSPFLEDAIHIIPPVSLKRMKDRAGVLTSLNQGRSFERIVHEFNQLRLTLEDPITALLFNQNVVLLQ